MPDSRFPFSNFELIPGCLTYQGIDYPTTEHAYQAVKFDDPKIRQRIADFMTAGEAKRFARTATLPVDWESTKVQIMAKLLCQKFKREPFSSRIVSYDGDIVEWNTWHDV